MSDLIYALSATGLLPVMIGITIAFGAIALYFGFIKKS